MNGPLCHCIEGGRVTRVQDVKTNEGGTSGTFVLALLDAKKCPSVSPTSRPHVFIQINRQVLHSKPRWPNKLNQEVGAATIPFVIIPVDH